MPDNSIPRTSWRKRLSSLVAAVAASFALTSGPPAIAAISPPQTTPPNPEVRTVRNRLAKLVLRRSREGAIRVAQHESHESHSSHASHYSHYSSHTP
jgi:hypothetical protein